MGPSIQPSASWNFQALRGVQGRLERIGIAPDAAYYFGLTSLRIGGEEFISEDVVTPFQGRELRYEGVQGVIMNLTAFGCGNTITLAPVFYFDVRVVNDR